MSEFHRWTEQELEILRRAYEIGSETIDRALGIAPHAPPTAPLTPEQPPADHGDGSDAGGREGGEGA